jgi:hypothetical protein
LKLKRQGEERKRGDRDSFLEECVWMDGIYGVVGRDLDEIPIHEMIYKKMPHV